MNKKAQPQNISLRGSQAFTVPKHAAVVNLDPQLERLAAELAEAGWYFECEELGPNVLFECRNHLGQILHSTMANTSLHGGTALAECIVRAHDSWRNK